MISRGACKVAIGSTTPYLGCLSLTTLETEWFVINYALVDVVLVFFVSTGVYFFEGGTAITFYS